MTSRMGATDASGSDRSRAHTSSRAAAIAPAGSPAVRAVTYIDRSTICASLSHISVPLGWSSPFCFTSSTTPTISNIGPSPQHCRSRCPMGLSPGKKVSAKVRFTIRTGTPPMSSDGSKSRPSASRRPMVSR